MTILSALGAAGAMLVLILDSQTAIAGAAAAVSLCIRTAIPSLFPFFVLSGLLVPYAAKLRIGWLGRLLKVSPGWESVFLLGCISGYPVGAQCVAQAYRSGELEEGQARRMVGFCTNCGPSFLFGIVGSAFSDLWTPIAIMVIGILSAVMVGAFWPGTESVNASHPSIQKISVSQAVQQAIRSMASVCAWIILGKVILAFLSKWLLSRLPANCAVLFSGLLELTNGCLALRSCTGESIRFVICCALVTFGGFCVVMQAVSVCSSAGLSPVNYLPQKAIQSCIATLLAVIYLYLPGTPILRLSFLTVICGFILIFLANCNSKLQ